MILLGLSTPIYDKISRIYDISSRLTATFLLDNTTFLLDYVELSTGEKTKQQDIVDRQNLGKRAENAGKTYKKLYKTTNFLVFTTKFLDFTTQSKVLSQMENGGTHGR